MIEWIDVIDSKRVVAIAYDHGGEIIMVRFPGGIEWQYVGCPQHIWEEFSSPATSKGQYINTVLNFHTNSRYVA
jgi:hypothetical protein